MCLAGIQRAAAKELPRRPLRVQLGSAPSLSIGCRICDEAKAAGKGGLPAVARWKAGRARLRACGAMAGNLRLDHERRLVDLTGIEPVTS